MLVFRDAKLLALRLALISISARTEEERARKTEKMRNGDPKSDVLQKKTQREESKQAERKMKEDFTL